MTFSLFFAHYANATTCNSLSFKIIQSFSEKGIVLTYFLIF